MEDEYKKLIEDVSKLKHTMEQNEAAVIENVVAVKKLLERCDVLFTQAPKNVTSVKLDLDVRPNFKSFFNI